MKKILTAQDRIRIALSLGGEFLSQLYGGDGSMNWYYRPWNVLNINNDTYRKALKRLMFTGEINKITDPKKGVLYQMSASGKSKFYRNFPLTKLRESPWDGQWRIVIYDLPVKMNYKRDRLRVKLLELGFGCYQKSVYVTPLDVIAELKEYLDSQELTDLIVIFEASRTFGEGTKLLAERLWSLNSLNKEYFVFEDRLKIFTSKGRPKCEYGELWKEFSTILLKDPFVPNEFLPDNWVGDRVKAEMLAIKIS